MMRVGTTGWKINSDEDTVTAYPAEAVSVMTPKAAAKARRRRQRNIRLPSR